MVPPEVAAVAASVGAARTPSSHPLSSRIPPHPCTPQPFNFVPSSYTAVAALAATAVQCPRTQSQAVGLGAVTSKQGMVPPEVAAAAAASMAAARTPSSHPSSLIPPDSCTPQPPDFVSSSQLAAAAAPAAAAVQCPRFQSQAVGLLAVTSKRGVAPPKVAAAAVASLAAAIANYPHPPSS